MDIPNDFKKYIIQQKQICEKYGTSHFESSWDLKVGISKNILEGVLPVNGLRHPPEGDTNGWYIWGGETYSDIVDFFVPLHIKHLTEWHPDILKYMGLPPGWRFLFAENYEDVWRDDNLLNIEWNG